MARLKIPAERRIATVAALVGVNTFAVAGQASWAYSHLGHNPWVAAAFAAVLESISLYLTAQATAAMLANDKAATLRLTAYAMAAGMGVMNYVAHAPDWRPNAMAIAFGLLSASSPWLWTIDARRRHRDELAAEGLIDRRTVKLPGMLWLLYPARAFGMLKLAVWTGENRPAAVRTMYAERAALTRLTPADAVRYAWGALGHYEPHAARVWLQQRGVMVDQATLDEAIAARPPAVPARLALPISVSPAPTPTPASLPAPAPVPAESPAELDAPSIDPASREYHQAQLDACTSKRAMIRYAFTVLGHREVPATRAWLAEYGIDVSRSEAHAVARGFDSPTGEHPIVGATVLNLPERVNGHPVSSLTASAG